MTGDLLSKSLNPMRLRKRCLWLSRRFYPDRLAGSTTIMGDLTEEGESEDSKNNNVVVVRGIRKDDAPEDLGMTTATTVLRWRALGPVIDDGGVVRGRCVHVLQQWIWRILLKKRRLRCTWGRASYGRVSGGVTAGPGNVWQRRRRHRKKMGPRTQWKQWRRRRTSRNRQLVQGIRDDDGGGSGSTPVSRDLQLWWRSRRRKGATTTGVSLEVKD